MTVQTKIIHTELCAYKTVGVCASCLSIKIKYSIFMYYISNIYICIYNMHTHFSISYPASHKIVYK